MAQSTGKERRQHPRVPLGITMNIHANGQTVGKCRGTIADLSIGGMSFKTSADLQEGETLYLKVNIPLEIRGEVRHIKTGSGPMQRYGVRFHKFGFMPAEETRPERFIAAQFQKEKK